jgi:hypothetical protein
MFAVSGPVRTPAGCPARWKTPASKTVLAEHSVAQINHYFTRSAEDWRRKLARGYEGSKRAEALRERFKQFDRNEIEDRGILRFAPAVRAVLDAVGLGLDEGERAA